MTGKGIIFDGDDTLWETMPLYTKAKNKYFQLMKNEGVGYESFADRFEGIDNDNVSKYGFSRLRFPQSMVDAYRDACCRCARVADADIENEVRRIGESVFSEPVLLLDSAKEVVEQLRNDFRLVLVTKGDREVQKQRITQSGLEYCFDATYIVDTKTQETFIKVLDEQTLDRYGSWSIGNSVKSDINPAIAAGLRAIWIPYETWKHETGENERSDRLFVCSQLTEIITVINRESR